MALAGTARKNNNPGQIIVDISFAFPALSAEAKAAHFERKERAITLLLSSKKMKGVDISTTGYPYVREGAGKRKNCKVAACTM